ncbi:hypothetical protein GA0116948_1285 [Chitinophaga costaii]|uniref:Uncharacterized protein n=1 Tax=Chitinophaga costaii TaxID=1335309 RepID=A0A1C4G7U7_9BACT|nr:hypothetical protein [Chitinophaga costaii]PUZ19489.1 hypothetical protein DCM91_20540 [Chitinophaga costaii]SCC64232.1 hypothetical protein GA0116948_1285 [Chitinophaga costaii]
MNDIICRMTFSVYAFLLLGCSAPTPTRQEIVGKWAGNGGASVTIMEDGTFTGKHFPFKKFFPPSFIKPQDAARTEFDCGGTWVIKYENPYWKVILDFKTSSVPGYLCNTSLLIGGENGVLENRPPWYLYYWLEEEGGARFRFLKVPNPKTH